MLLHITVWTLGSKCTNSALMCVNEKAVAWYLWPEHSTAIKFLSKTGSFTSRDSCFHTWWTAASGCKTKQGFCEISENYRNGNSSSKHLASNPPCLAFRKPGGEEDRKTDWLKTCFSSLQQSKLEQTSETSHLHLRHKPWTLPCWEPHVGWVSAGCVLTGTTGRQSDEKEWKCEERFWICPMSPSTPGHMPPEPSDRARSTPAAEGVSKSVWLTIGKGALKNTNKFDIHFLILASSLCFLSKASFKVQNLFQWRIPNKTFKEEIFI